MPSRSLLRPVIIVVLALSVALKLWTLGDARAAGPSDDEVRETLRAFLAQDGFAARVETGITGLPAASGERAECRVALANVAAQGYHRDLIVSKASPEDGVAFLFRGRAYPDQPEWATWASRLMAQIRLVPADRDTSEGTGNDRVFALIEGPGCAIDRLLWAERLHRLPM